MVTSKYLIYKADLNGKSYVGLTKDLQSRIWYHNNGKVYGYFTRAIRKHGSEKVKWSVLKSHLSLSLAIQYERYFIKRFDTYNNGYNLTKGGDGTSGYTWTEDQKRNLSAKKIGVPHTESHNINKGLSIRKYLKFNVYKKDQLLGTFYSAIECINKLKDYNLQKPHVSQCLKGIRVTHRGLRFEIL